MRVVLPVGSEIQADASLAHAVAGVLLALQGSGLAEADMTVYE
jgi:hypothetical protein